MAMVAAASLSAEEFELVDSSFTAVDRASGGDFSLELALLAGPVPAEPVEGGDFSVAGPDPWPVVLDQTTSLSLVVRPDGRLELRFSGPFAGAMLEASSDLEAWNPVPERPADGSPWPIEPTGNQRYFRIRR